MEGASENSFDALFSFRGVAEQQKIFAERQRREVGLILRRVFLTMLSISRESVERDSPRFVVLLSQSAVDGETSANGSSKDLELETLREV